MDEKKDDVEKNTDEKKEEKIDSIIPDKQRDAGEKEEQAKLKQDNNIDKESEKSLKEKQNRQIRWVVILMTSLILIILIVPYVNHYFFNTFTYIDLDFQKTKLGEILFFSSKIPLADINGNVIGSFPINIRSDPRELEYIKVDIPENMIAFKKNKPIYISIKSDAPPCEYNAVAVAGLTGFLKDFGNLEVKGALDNKTFAEENRLAYATCGSHPDNTVIRIVNSNVTEIKKINDNCYELAYKDCEILQVTEKFSLVILEYYMGFFEEDES